MRSPRVPSRLEWSDRIPVWERFIPEYQASSSRLHNGRVGQLEDFIKRPSSVAGWSRGRTNRVKHSPMIFSNSVGWNRRHYEPDNPVTSLIGRGRAASPRVQDQRGKLEMPADLDEERSSVPAYRGETFVDEHPEVFAIASQLENSHNSGGGGGGGGGGGAGNDTADADPTTANDPSQETDMLLLPAPPSVQAEGFTAQDPASVDIGRSRRRPRTVASAMRDPAVIWPHQERNQAPLPTDCVAHSPRFGRRPKQRQGGGGARVGGGGGAGGGAAAGRRDGDSRRGSRSSPRTSSLLHTTRRIIQAHTPPPRRPESTPSPARGWDHHHHHHHQEEPDDDDSTRPSDIHGGGGGGSGGNAEGSNDGGGRNQQTADEGGGGGKGARARARAGAGAGAEGEPATPADQDVVMYNGGYPSSFSSSTSPRRRLAPSARPPPRNKPQTSKLMSPRTRGLADDYLAKTWEEQVLGLRPMSPRRSYRGKRETRWTPLTISGQAKWNNFARKGSLWKDVAVE